MEDVYLTTRQAAELLGVSPETVIRWILHDGLAARRVRCRGGQCRYRVLRQAALARLEVVEGERDLRPALAAPLNPYTRELAERYGLLKFYRGPLT